MKIRHFAAGLRAGLAARAPVPVPGAGRFVAGTLPDAKARVHGSVPGRRVVTERAHMPASRGPAFRSIAAVMCVTVLSASCTNYKARLSDLSPPASADAVPPRPHEEIRSVFEEKKVAGSVRARVDIDADGKVAAVEIIESSDAELDPLATRILQGWKFEPGTRGGAPDRFDGIELTLVLFTDDSTTTEEAVGKTLLVIVLIPLYLLAALAGGAGSFKFK